MSTRRVNVLAKAPKPSLEDLFGTAANVSSTNKTNTTTTNSTPPPKSTETTQLILSAMKSNQLISKLVFGLEAEQQQQIIDAMWPMTIASGTTIIREGDLGDRFYIVENGLFDVRIANEKVSERGPGSSFGELALLYNTPRAATIIALKDSTVWVVDRRTFKRLLTQQYSKQIKENERLLNGVPAFDVLKKEQRLCVIEALEEVSFGTGHEIIKQGTPGDTFFIIKKGTAVCTQTLDGITTTLAAYQAGDYFGERALVTNEPRAATVTASSRVSCLYLKQEQFVSLLGPMLNVFRARVEGYQMSPAPLARRVSVPLLSGPSSTSTSSGIALADLKDIRVVSRDKGVTKLVKHDKTDQTYFLQVLSKRYINKLGFGEHLLQQKFAMSKFKSSFVQKFHGTFKDNDSVYFLMEPVLGGDLYTILDQHTKLDEDAARFYAAGVILGLEQIHSKSCIYRGLQPEKILLDQNGYPKLCEFEFAKEVTDRTWTLCGTPDYLSPEIILGVGHNRAVDWWALGILIYEMLAGSSPFTDKNPNNTFVKILSGKMTFPKHFSEAVVDLVINLLASKPSRRLGMTSEGVKAIKTHDWFKDFDWDAYEKHSIAAPIQPVTVESAVDPVADEELEDAQAAQDSSDWDAEF